MLVQFNQREIVAALTQYLAYQGISTQNKTIDMAFTAGRKETGISVDINIEDSDLPDLPVTADEVAENRSLLKVVPPTVDTTDEDEATPVTTPTTSLFS